MNGFIRSLSVLFVVVALVASVVLASAQTPDPAPIGPPPVMPCTQPDDDAEAQASDESPLAELERFLARVQENSFDAHVEALERCYPLYFDPEVSEMWA